MESNLPSICVSNLSYSPPNFKVLRDAVAKVAKVLAPLNIQWMLPNYHEIGKDLTHAELKRINFHAVAGSVNAIMGRKEERNELVRLLTTRNRHGTFSGDILLTGSKISSQQQNYFGSVAFIQRVC